MAGRDTRSHRLSGGAALRAERERLGLSLDDVSGHTRIPRKYLEAIERDDESAFPRGPFLASYSGQYRRFLGAGDAPAPRVAPYTPEPTITSTSPRLSTRRFGRGAMLVGLLAIAGWLVFAIRGEVGEAVSETPVGVPPDLTLLVTVVEPVRAKVVSDGRPIFKGALAPGLQHSFAAHDRLDVQLATLDQVTLVYRRGDLKAQRLKPLGEQGAPRRLVFIDDEGR